MVAAMSGLFSQLEFKWALIQAAAGIFGLMAWLLLLKLSISEGSAEHP
ncbi:MAG TPA: hypothetical protein VF553_14585 [Pyrinomonadaceae bacterium]|jgi:hypothetical protein